MLPACHNAIIDGLELLYALRLAFAPNESQIEACIDAWLVALAPYAKEEADSERIRQGFVRLSGELSQWPAPKALIERLAVRPLPRLAALPSISEAERQANLAVIDALMVQMGRRSQSLKGAPVKAH